MREGTHQGSDIPSGEPGLHCPPREDPADTHPDNRVPGDGESSIHATLELRVPGRKLKKIRQEATKVHNQEPPPTTREVSRLLGKLSSVSQAIPPGPLFCRAIQRDLASALERDSQSYNGPCHCRWQQRKNSLGGAIS